jgi:hypothetical protein
LRGRVARHGAACPKDKVKLEPRGARGLTLPQGQARRWPGSESTATFRRHPMSTTTQANATTNDRAAGGCNCSDCRCVECRCGTASACACPRTPAAAE